MTEKFLRDALKEAQEKGQACLLVWANRDEFLNHSAKLDTFIFLKKQKYEMVYGRTANMSSKGIANFVSSNRGWFMAIPVKKFENPRYFHYILQLLQREDYHGPISFIPSRETFLG